MIIMVLAVRFLLEVITVLGIFSGVYFKQSFILKLIFFILGIGIVLLWGFFGAPKSQHSLQGYHKLGLEILVYGLGAASFFGIFGWQTGVIYTMVAGIDLALMYALHLQGH